MSVKSKNCSGAHPSCCCSKRKRGRPSTNFDKRAYQREYMRRRRAKARLLRQGENNS